MSIERPSKATDLLTIRFRKATVYYTEGFAVIIEGALWPRQLRAANNIIATYQQCTREDKEENKDESQSS